VHNIIELNLHKMHLEEMVEEHAANLRHTNERLVDSLSAIIEHRSAESGQHILRIRRFTQVLLDEVAKTCPEYNLDERLVNVIASASALHDIGKISIPDAILNKPAKLTPDERKVIETHTTIGCRILESLSDIGDYEYLRYAHNICHYHHERWDGKGYPEGIAGDDIPICAQAVGLADVYDALTSKRVYKEAYSFESSVNMILNGECGEFSPKLLECFKHVSSKFETLARAYADGLSPKTEHFDATLPSPAENTDVNTLDTVQTKYLSLLHYMNAFVAEVDLGKNQYHLIYNPYAELSMLKDASGFTETQQLFLKKIVVSKDRDRMRDLFSSGISTFIDAGLRRQTHFFDLNRPYIDIPITYELTLLRPNLADSSNKLFLMILKRAESKTLSADNTIPLSDSAAGELIKGVFYCRNDACFTFGQSSPIISKLTGYSFDELDERFENKFINLIHPEDAQAVIKSCKEQLTYRNFTELEYRLLTKNGEPVWVISRLKLALGHDGKEYLYGVFTDISGAKRSYDKLSERLERYEIILSQTENVLFDWDLTTDSISFSDTWESIFGYEPINSKVFEALEYGSFFHPDDLPMLLDSINEIMQGAAYRMTEVRIATNTGRYLWCRFRASAIRSDVGTLVRIVGVIINIDSEKRSSQLLLDKAERDTLTKLLNKPAAKNRIEKFLSQEQDDAKGTMLIIDLDNFKLVNDLHGHMFGDAVLEQAARELKSLFRSQDIVARIGGDEFMVLMCGVCDRDIIEDRCEKLISIFKGLFADQLCDCSLGCSVGVAIAPEHGSDYYTLFQHTDQALYQAKNRGKNTFVFFGLEETLLESWRSYVSAVNERIDSDAQTSPLSGSMLQKAFHRLYLSDDIEKSINELLALAGEYTNVSRVYIFENTPDNRFCNNTFEWCNTGVDPEIHNLQGVCYETDIPDYLGLYNEHGILYCQDINTLPRNVYNVVAPQGIRSMLHCAIRENGAFRGYIGFDECHHNRLWTKDQIDLLSVFSEMLSIFLMKKRAEDTIIRQRNDLLSILDNQNSWIYVIDPDTCELKFLNEKSRALSPNVEEGSYCYKELMDRDERCPDCPALGIRDTRSCSRNITNEKFKLNLISEATLINWDKGEACLVTCRENK